MKSRSSGRADEVKLIVTDTDTMVPAAGTEIVEFAKPASGTLKPPPANVWL